MAKVVQVFSGMTSPTAIAESSTFENAAFLFFAPSGIGNSEGYEVAGSLLVDIRSRDIVGGVPFETAYGVKEIPLQVDFLDTAQIVPIPFEVGNTGLSVRVCLATSYALALDIYAVTTAVNLEAIADKVDFANNLLTALSVRNLAGDAIAVGNFLVNLTSLLSGNLTALPALIGDLLVGTGVAALPFGGDFPGVIDVEYISILGD